MGGDAGVGLLREIHQNPALPYEIVGFIDDDPAKSGNFIHRVKVFGNGAVCLGRRSQPSTPSSSPCPPPPARR